MDFNQPSFEIKTERLFLRPLQAEDVPCIFNIARKYPEMTKFMSWSPPAKIEETEGFFEASEKAFEEGTAVRWGIFYEDEFCGIVGVEGICRKHLRWELNQGEIGYWLSPEFQKKGIMPEAVRGVLSFAFGSMKLHKVVTSHIAENVPSQKVIVKSGFEYVGKRKKHLLDRGKWWDLELYEMLAEDFLRHA